MFGKITEYSAKLPNILLYQEAPTAKYQSRNAEFRQFYRIFGDFAEYLAINEYSFHHRNSEFSPKDFRPNIRPIFGPNIRPETHFGESLANSFPCFMMANAAGSMLHLFSRRGAK